MASSIRAALGRLVGAAVRAGAQAGAREVQRRLTRGGEDTGPRQGPRPSGAGPAPTRVQVRRPPREATGPLRFDYAPKADGRPDPGEIVWAWVPFEEGDGRGKDRPVLVISRDGEDLLGLMLTSKDHDRDAADEARHGRHWVDIGSGAWDAQRRPSEVRVDRVLRLGVTDVRREGAALDRARFDLVAAEVRRLRG